MVFVRIIWFREGRWHPILPLAARGWSATFLASTLAGSKIGPQRARDAKIIAAGRKTGPQRAREGGGFADQVGE